jgi:hypothetical protein
VSIVDSFMRMADVLPSSSDNVYGYPKFHSYSFSMTCLTILLLGQKVQHASKEEVKAMLVPNTKTVSRYYIIIYNEA